MHMYLVMKIQVHSSNVYDLAWLTLGRLTEFPNYGDGFISNKYVELVEIFTYLANSTIYNVAQNS